MQKSPAEAWPKPKQKYPQNLLGKLSHSTSPAKTPWWLEVIAWSSHRWRTERAKRFFFYSGSLSTSGRTLGGRKEVIRTKSFLRPSLGRVDDEEEMDVFSVPVASHQYLSTLQPDISMRLSPNILSDYVLTGECEMSERSIYNYLSSPLKQIYFLRVPHGNKIKQILENLEA